MFDNDKPSETATQDLVGDGGTCNLNSYLTSISSALPTNAVWLMFCENAWTDVAITIAPPTCMCKLGYTGDNCEPTTTTTSITTTTTAAAVPSGDGEPTDSEETAAAVRATSLVAVAIAAAAAAVVG